GGEARHRCHLELLRVARRADRRRRMDPGAALRAAQELEPPFGAAAPEVLVGARHAGQDPERKIGHVPLRDQADNRATRRGPNTSAPITTDAIAATSTAPAARSLAIPTRASRSGWTASARASTALFRPSATQTSAITRTIQHHSPAESPSQRPSAIA